MKRCNGHEETLVSSLASLLQSNLFVENVWFYHYSAGVLKSQLQLFMLNEYIWRHFSFPLSIMVNVPKIIEHNGLVLASSKMNAHFSVQHDSDSKMLWGSLCLDSTHSVWTDRNLLLFLVILSYMQKVKMTWIPTVSAKLHNICGNLYIEINIKMLFLNR